MEHRGYSQRGMLEALKDSLFFKDILKSSSEGFFLRPS
jgi:hypothetical protein